MIQKIKDIDDKYFDSENTKKGDTQKIALINSLVSKKRIIKRQMQKKQIIKRQMQKKQITEALQGEQVDESAPDSRPLALFYR